MSVLTPTGQPRLGARIEVQLADDSWWSVKVVGKALGRGALHNTVIGVCLEESNGARSWQPWGDHEGVIWRAARKEEL